MATSSDIKAADKMLASGDVDGATQAYRKIASESKSSVDAEIKLATVYRKTQHPQDALNVMLDAQKRQPDNQEVLMNLGYAQIAADQSQEAVTTFDQVINSHPENALAYSGKAIAFDKSGNHLAAQELYEHALKLSPGSLAIQNNLAMSLILNNQLTQAIDILESLSNSAPDNRTIRQNLALAYGLKGNRQKALELNKMDVSEEEAKDNLLFYEKYANKRRGMKFIKPENNEQIGFEQAPADEAKVQKKVKKQVKTPEPTPEPTPVAEKPVEKQEPVAPAPAPAPAPADNMLLPHTEMPTSNPNEQPSQFPSAHR